MLKNLVDSGSRPSPHGSLLGFRQTRHGNPIPRGEPSTDHTPERGPCREGFFSPPGRAPRIRGGYGLVSKN